MPPGLKPSCRLHAATTQALSENLVSKKAGAQSSHAYGLCRTQFVALTDRRVRLLDVHGEVAARQRSGNFERTLSSRHSAGRRLSLRRTTGRTDEPVAIEVSALIDAARAARTAS
jgi:hypothetical protein